MIEKGTYLEVITEKEFNSSGLGISLADGQVEPVVGNITVSGDIAMDLGSYELEEYYIYYIQENGRVIRREGKTDGIDIVYIAEGEPGYMIEDVFWGYKKLYIPKGSIIKKGED